MPQEIWGQVLYFAYGYFVSRYRTGQCARGGKTRTQDTRPDPYATDPPAQRKRPEAEASGRVHFTRMVSSSPLSRDVAGQLQRTLGPGHPLAVGGIEYLEPFVQRDGVEDIGVDVIVLGGGRDETAARRLEVR